MECVSYRQTKAEIKQCSSCKTARYCSQACQKLHWKKHRNACNQHQILIRRHMQFIVWNDKWCLSPKMYKANLKSPSAANPNPRYQPEQKWFTSLAKQAHYKNSLLFSMIFYPLTENIYMYTSGGPEPIFLVWQKILECIR